MIGGGEPLKVLDCQYKLLSILFLRVAFPQNQVIEFWQLTYC